MIDEHERRRMRKAHSIGPRMIAYLEEIGVRRLDDLVDADADDLAMRIDIVLGARRLNRLGIEALQNLIELAGRECARRDG
jgi:nucleotidyltransferase/DNA polymerase involved in DNA repair